MEYPPEILACLAALCEAEPAREACGFVVRRGAALEVVPATNRAARPEDAYLVDPGEQLRLHRDLDARGGAIVAVWHSHVEADATLSARDRAAAVIGGRPAVPGAEQLVLSVRGGRVAEVRRYRWAGARYVEAPLGRAAC